jgi:hypothetical protein
VSEILLDHVQDQRAQLRILDAGQPLVELLLVRGEIMLGAANSLGDCSDLRMSGAIRAEGVVLHRLQIRSVLDQLPLHDGQHVRFSGVETHGAQEQVPSHERFQCQQMLAEISSGFHGVANRG